MPSYAVVTFGCQMNVHDSDRMHEVLRRGGYVEAPSEAEADVVVLNTCSVREKAENKLRSEVGRLTVEKKRRGGDLSIVVAGCVAQQEGERLLKRMPAIDVILGPDNILELPGLLADVATGGLPKVRTVFDTETPAFLPAATEPPRTTAPTAFVTIMKGCDERCSFCVVPYTRGPERYRPSAEIIDEIRRLVRNGIIEVTLLGQTVNSYTDPSKALDKAPECDLDDPDESEFAALLRLVAREVPELGRLRYTSPHPRHITPSLIAAHRDIELLAEHVHMPVQSGSDRVLKRMIRRYTRAEYVDRVGRLQAARKGLTLSTDIIVGFPGETAEEADATVDLIRQVGFLSVYAFKYSVRPHTPARKLEDDVPEAEKGRRLANVFAVSEDLLQQHLHTLVDTRQQVLVEGPSKTGEGMFAGRTVRNAIVHIEGAGDRDVVGRIVPVDVYRANRHSVVGRLPEGLELPRRAPQRMLKVLALGAPLRGAFWLRRGLGLWRCLAALSHPGLSNAGPGTPAFLRRGLGLWRRLAALSHPGPSNAGPGTPAFLRRGLGLWRCLAAPFHPGPPNAGPGTPAFLRRLLSSSGRTSSAPAAANSARSRSFARPQTARPSLQRHPLPTPTAGGIGKALDGVRR
jgi:tRNA-2-methylthio-N6-dimethylallyladenosine synthase